MKRFFRNNWPVLILVLFVAMLAMSVHSQEAGPSPFPLPMGEGIAGANPEGLVQAVVDSLGARHGWVAAVLMWMGVLRMVFKPVVSAVESYVRSTPGREDDEFLERVEHGPIFTKVCWLLDFFASVKVGPQFVAKPAGETPSGTGGTPALPMLALCLFVAVGASGCATKLAAGGAYHEDKVLFNADETITDAREALHDFVQWEYEHREALAKWPEVRKAADYVRLNARWWVISAMNLRAAYAANPIPKNRESLESGLGVLRSEVLKAAEQQASVIGNGDGALGTARPTLKQTQ